MFKTWVLQLNPSKENAHVLMCLMMWFKTAEEREIKYAQKGMVDRSSHYYLSQIFKRNHTNKNCAVFPSGSYFICKNNLYLKMGKRFCYERDIMKIPLKTKENQKGRKGTLKITIKDSQWVAYIIKKAG